MEFKIGDRVRCIEERTNKYNVVGKIGMIISVYNKEDISVEFEEFINGHTCQGKCRDGYGWNFSKDNLELIKKNAYDNMAPSDQRLLDKMDELIAFIDKITKE